MRNLTNTVETDAPENGSDVEAVMETGGEAAPENDAPESPVEPTAQNGEEVTPQNGETPSPEVTVEAVAPATVATITEKRTAAETAWNTAAELAVAGTLTDFAITAVSQVFAALGSNENTGALATMEKHYGAAIANRVSFTDPTTFPIGAALGQLRLSLAEAIEPLLTKAPKTSVPSDPTARRAYEVEVYARTWFVVQCLCALVGQHVPTSLDNVTDDEQAVIDSYAADESLIGTLDRIAKLTERSVTGKAPKTAGSSSPAAERQSQEHQYVTGAKFSHTYRDGSVDRIEVISGNGSVNDATLKIALNGDRNKLFTSSSEAATAAVGGDPKTNRRNGLVHWSLVS